MIIVKNFLSISLYIIGSSQIFKMLVKTFENIEKNIIKNIVKLNLKQNNILYCIIIWSTYLQSKIIFDEPARYDWELTLKKLTVRGHNWVTFNCDFNFYLIITRSILNLKNPGWLQGYLSLSYFRDGSNEYQQPLVIIKLSPRSGFV